MHSIEARFEQTILDSQGAVLQEARGIVRIKRPQQFYWLTESPYEHLVVTDGSVLWLHDIDLEQVSKKPFVDDEDSAPALLLSGNVDKLREQYVITKAKTAGTTEYQLDAKDKDTLFVGLTISFRDRVVTSMSFSDSFEQQTRIDFSSFVVNTEIPDDLFQFAPPAGVDILDETLSSFEYNQNGELSTSVSDNLRNSNNQ